MQTSWRKKTTPNSLNLYLYIQMFTLKNLKLFPIVKFI